MRIAVVGAGIAGLAVALGCEHAGHEVTVYEESETVGGRMKTLQEHGHTMDAGFHVLHTAYPTVQRWIDLEALDAKAMDNCTVSIHPERGRRRLLGDALRSPQYMLPTLRSVGVSDGVRFLKWRMATRASDLERSLDTSSPSISEGLRSRNFRPSTQRVLRSLFAGITLDPSLNERFSFADFTWSAMAHGKMVVPRQGIQAVPLQLARRLKAGTVRCNTQATSVSATSVTTADGVEEYDCVVLATPQHVTHRLLPAAADDHPLHERLTSTVVFQAKAPPFKRARLLLNEQWGAPGHSVLHVHVPTNLHPSDDGTHLVVATLVGPEAAHPDVHAVATELEQWFGSQVKDWRHLCNTTVRHALPHQDPEHHGRLVQELLVDGVYLVGDHRAHPSVQGALASAERLLTHLGLQIPPAVNG